MAVPTAVAAAMEVDEAEPTGNDPYYTRLLDQDPILPLMEQAKAPSSHAHSGPGSVSARTETHASVCILADEKLGNSSSPTAWKELPPLNDGDDDEPPNNPWTLIVATAFCMRLNRRKKLLQELTNWFVV
jgi:hypothetical protein